MKDFEQKPIKKKYNKKKEGIINAMTMKQIAKQEGKHYMTVVMQKDKKYVPITVNISDKKKVVRYLTKEISNKVRNAIESPEKLLNRSNKIKIAFDIYKVWQNETKYKLTDKKYQKWLEDEFNGIQEKEGEEIRNKTMDIILKPNETACIKENKPILYKKVVQKTEIDKNEFKNLLQDFIKKPL